MTQEAEEYDTEMRIVGSVYVNNNIVGGAEVSEGIKSSWGDRIRTGKSIGGGTSFQIVGSAYHKEA